MFIDVICVGCCVVVIYVYEFYLWKWICLVMYCLFMVDVFVCLYLEVVFVYKLCVYLYFVCKGLIRLKWLIKKSYMLFL